jgi:hypothetical protein
MLLRPVDFACVSSAIVARLNVHAEMNELINFRLGEQDGSIWVAKDYGLTFEQQLQD